MISAGPEAQLYSRYINSSKQSIAQVILPRGRTQSVPISTSRARRRANPDLYKYLTLSTVLTEKKEPPVPYQ
jgi:hypothetical protein